MNQRKWKKYLLQVRFFERIQKTEFTDFGTEEQ